MKTKLFGITLVVLAIFATVAGKTYANGDGGTIHVKGNNDADCADGKCDSKSLQDALDAANPGAKLVLKGVFDFGDGHFVSLKKDVTIKGERGRQGEYLAIIKGGMNTFALGWDPAFGFAEWDENFNLIANPNTERYPANFVIEDLQFEKATWNTIFCAATTGTSIRNNRFIDGLQYRVGPSSYGIPGYDDGYSKAITFSTNPWQDHPVFGVASDITGRIVIEGNFVDSKVRMDPVNGFDPIHGFASIYYGQDIFMNGILIPIVIEAIEADITIQRNGFINTQWGSMFIVDVSGAHIIRENNIKMEPVDEDGDPIGFGVFGISIQFAYDAPVLVEKNHIVQRLRANLAGGMLIKSDGGIVRKNTIEQYQSPESLWPSWGFVAGIALGREFDLGYQNGYIARNTIKGAGQYAIYVESSPDAIAENNVLEKNDIGDFTPQDVEDIWCRLYGGQDCLVLPGAHYYLSAWTRDNVVEDGNWTEEMMLIDKTSDYNPYDPDTYNGDNEIKLEHGH